MGVDCSGYTPKLVVNGNYRFPLSWSTESEIYRTEDACEKMLSTYVIEFQNEEGKIAQAGI